MTEPNCNELNVPEVGVTLHAATTEYSPIDDNEEPSKLDSYQSLFAHIQRIQVNIKTTRLTDSELENISTAQQCCEGQ